MIGEWFFGYDRTVIWADVRKRVPKPLPAHNRDPENPDCIVPARERYPSMKPFRSLATAEITKFVQL